jgi:hypothetical protein
MYMVRLAEVNINTIFTHIIFAVLASFLVKKRGCENYARKFWKVLF